jgi:sporulation protein YlmC with PRC-barrel domain
MPEGRHLELGLRVGCKDGPLGELCDVVVDPVGKRVTHLVVRTRDGIDRLVPKQLVADGEGDAIVLTCGTEEAEQLPPVQEFEYLRAGEAHAYDPEWDVGIEEVLAMPYYSASGLGIDPGVYDGTLTRTYDRVPKGEVEVRRASGVYSSDGHHLGHVEGFVVDGDHITHVVLERGHLWGRRDITIPIGAVASIDTDSVSVELTKEQVGELPALRVHRWRS